MFHVIKELPKVTLYLNVPLPLKTNKLRSLLKKEIKKIASSQPKRRRNNCETIVIRLDSKRV